MRLLLKFSRVTSGYIWNVSAKGARKIRAKRVEQAVKDFSLS